MYNNKLWLVSSLFLCWHFTGRSRIWRTPGQSWATWHWVQRWQGKRTCYATWWHCPGCQLCCSVSIARLLCRRFSSAIILGVFLIQWTFTNSHLFAQFFSQILKYFFIFYFGGNHLPFFVSSCLLLNYTN